MTANIESAPRNTSWQTEVGNFSWIHLGTGKAMAPATERASWTDARLIEAVRGEPSDQTALEILVGRYWGAVFARCQMLTQNHDKALDLAQETWHRLMRARHTLRPEGNFPAYLSMIAMNLFRDSYRSSRRAGPMSRDRLESLDAVYSNDSSEGAALGEFIPDPTSLEPAEQRLLAIDIDEALEKLTPHLREVVVARFIDGESCAEIGLRHGRTEQTVSGWVRQALREMKSHLEGRSDEGEDKESEVCAAGSNGR